MGGSLVWRKNNHRNRWPISILCGSPPERVRWSCIFGPNPMHLVEQINVISASSLMTWRITGAGSRRQARRSPQRNQSRIDHVSSAAILSAIWLSLQQSRGTIAWHNKVIAWLESIHVRGLCVLSRSTEGKLLKALAVLHVVILSGLPGAVTHTVDCLGRADLVGMLAQGFDFLVECLCDINPGVRCIGSHHIHLANRVRLQPFYQEFGEG